MTPEEIERREFPGGFRGYRRVPVRDFLREVGNEVAVAREAAVDRPALEAQRMLREAETQAQSTIGQAQRQAEELVAAAQRRAAQITAAAQHHAHQLSAQVEQDAARATAEAEALSNRILDRARRHHDELVTSARTESETLLQTTRHTAITEASAAVLRAEQRLNVLVGTEREVFDRLVRAMHALRGMAGPDVTLEAFLGPELAARVHHGTLPVVELGADDEVYASEDSVVDVRDDEPARVDVDLDAR